MKELIYPMLPDFRKSIAFWKDLRLRPFVLLVTATSMQHLWNYIYRGNPEILVEKPVAVPL
jgi:hypothetical protein